MVTVLVCFFVCFGLLFAHSKRASGLRPCWSLEIHPNCKQVINYQHNINAPFITRHCLFMTLSTMTSWASSATCRWPRPAHHTPCRHMTRRRRRGPAATLSSISTTWTTTPLSWTCSSLKKRSSYCWINRPLETPGNPFHLSIPVKMSVSCAVLCWMYIKTNFESMSFLYPGNIFHCTGNRKRFVVNDLEMWINS